MVKITGTEQGSIAAKKGIRAGDVLLSVNGKEIDDVLDYRFRMTARTAVLKLRRDGKEYSIRLKKDEDDTEIGLCFETPLMDEKHSCRNKCIFCFIDQNPKGMRETIYFKDDDSRLSFLHGNYITMTNLSAHEIDRIIEMHISPVNVSVHTTNPELRCRMMNNRFAGDSLAYLRRFADAGIRICAQVVLCRGINDGKELDRTMNDLVSYLPALDSVSVVPAGLTKHREGLCPLTDFSAEECAAVVKPVTEFGDMCVQGYGTRVFYAADEFYLRAGLSLPDEDFYGDFSQIEDGVGMLTSFRAEAMRALEDAEVPAGFHRRVSVATGYAACGMLQEICTAAQKKIPGLSVRLFRVRNDFFGESVTVAGLLTGQDIRKTVQGQSLGEALLISRRCLNADGDRFLDDMTPEELSASLGVPVIPNECDGYSFVDALLGNL